MPNPDFPPDLQQLDRYLVGELCPDQSAEGARVGEFVAAVRGALGAEWHPDRERVRALLRERITSGAARGHVGSESAFVPSSPVATRHGENRGRHVAARMVWYAIGTAMIGMVGVVVGWQTHENRVAVLPPKASTIYTTGNGQRATITLPDKSTATLNAASRLEVPADFATNR